jgi:quercetin dioxygenase-like cupin family protein
MTALASEHVRLEARLEEIELVEGWYEEDASVRVRFGAAFDAASGAASSSTLYLEVPPRHRTPWHTHSAEEVVYVLEGTAEAEVGPRKLRVDAGGLVLIPSGEPHGLENVGEGPLRFLAFFSSAAMVHVFDAPLEPFGTRLFTTPNPEQMPMPVRS